jgi:hypothetical protein
VKVFSVSWKKLQPFLTILKRLVADHGYQVWTGTTPEPQELEPAGDGKGKKQEGHPGRGIVLETEDPDVLRWLEERTRSEVSFQATATPGAATGTVTEISPHLSGGSPVGRRIPADPGLPGNRNDGQWIGGGAQKNEQIATDSFSESAEAKNRLFSLAWTDPAWEPPQESDELMTAARAASKPISMMESDAVPENPQGVRLWIPAELLAKESRLNRAPTVSVAENGTHVPVLNGHQKGSLPEERFSPELLVRPSIPVADDVISRKSEAPALESSVYPGSAVLDSDKNISSPGSFTRITVTSGSVGPDMATRLPDVLLWSEEIGEASEGIKVLISIREGVLPERGKEGKTVLSETIGRAFVEEPGKQISTGSVKAVGDVEQEGFLPSGRMAAGVKKPMKRERGLFGTVAMEKDIRFRLVQEMPPVVQKSEREIHGDFSGGKKTLYPPSGNPLLPGDGKRTAVEEVGGLRPSQPFVSGGVEKEADGDGMGRRLPVGQQTAASGSARKTKIEPVVGEKAAVHALPLAGKSGTNRAETPGPTIGFAGESAAFRESDISPFIREKEVFSQIVERIQWSLGRNERRIRVQLKPEYLGAILIEVRKVKEQIHAEIFVERPEVRQMLQHAAPQLQQALKDAGTVLHSVNIQDWSVSLEMQYQAGSQAQMSGYLREQRNGRRRAAGFETPAADVPETQMRTGRRFGYNTLELVV